MLAAAWALVTLTLFWLTGRLLPISTPPFRAAVAAAPLATWGWAWFLRQHPRIGWSLVFSLVVAVGLLVALTPARTRAAADGLTRFLGTEGVPVRVLSADP